MLSYYLGFFKSLKLKLKKQQQKSFNDPATLGAKNKKRQMTILFLHVNKTLAFTGSNKYPCYSDLLPITPRSIVIYCVLLKAELLYTYFIHSAEIDW